MTANAVAEGDLSRRSDPDRAPTPELARLLATINRMLDGLETSFIAKDRAESQLRQLIADASHELRTPLTSIRGYSELYLSGAAVDDESVAKQMTRINSEAERLGRLVGELFTLARLDQGEQRSTDDVDIAAVCRDAVSDALAAAPDSRHPRAHRRRAHDRQ